MPALAQPLPMRTTLMRMIPCFMFVPTLDRVRRDVPKSSAATKSRDPSKCFPGQPEYKLLHAKSFWNTCSQEPAAQPSLPRSGNRRRVVESDEDDEDEIRYVGHARPIFQFPPIHLQNPGAWEEDVSEGEDDLSGDESDGYGHYRDGYYEDSDGEIYSVNEEDGEFSGGDY